MTKPPTLISSCQESSPCLTAETGNLLATTKSRCFEALKSSISPSSFKDLDAETGSESSSSLKQQVEVSRSGEKQSWVDDGNSASQSFKHLEYFLNSLFLRSLSNLVGVAGRLVQLLYKFPGIPLVCNKA